VGKVTDDTQIEFSSSVDLPRKNSFGLKFSAYDFGCSDLIDRTLDVSLVKIADRSQVAPINVSTPEGFAGSSDYSNKKT
jgi:hypothetical protein